MLQNKLACNSTNSAAISDEGDLYVWGSAKHGILGTEVDSRPFYKPSRLTLTRQNHTNDCFSRTRLTKFKVDDISMGVSHMVAVAHDAEMSSQKFRPLEYAKHLLD